jgi:hypothetical protein
LAKPGRWQSVCSVRLDLSRNKLSNGGFRATEVDARPVALPQMVRKVNKSRFNEMRLDISDATPHKVVKPNRTKRRKKYARRICQDSTAGLDAQQRDLTVAGCERVFSEQVSSVASRSKLADVRASCAMVTC